MATISQVLAIIFATILGMIAGYTVRWADTLIMRIVDVLMAVPDLLLLILLIPVLSGSLTSSWAPSWLASFNDYTHDTFGLILGIFIISWIIVARLVVRRYCRCARRSSLLRR